MHHVLIKRITILSLFGFFLAVIAVAFHYNDDAFLLRSRSLCQGRTVISVAVNKNLVDSTLAVAVMSLGVTAVFLLSAPFIHISKTILISSRTGNLFPNKAPPVPS